MYIKASHRAGFVYFDLSFFLYGFECRRAGPPGRYYRLRFLRVSARTEHLDFGVTTDRSWFEGQSAIYFFRSAKWGRCTEPKKNIKRAPLTAEKKRTSAEREQLTIGKSLSKFRVCSPIANDVSQSFSQRAARAKRTLAERRDYKISSISFSFCLFRLLVRQLNNVAFNVEFTLNWKISVHVDRF